MSSPPEERLDWTLRDRERRLRPEPGRAAGNRASRHHHARCSFWGGALLSLIPAAYDLDEIATLVLLTGVATALWFLTRRWHAPLSIRRASHRIARQHERDCRRWDADRRR
ncbi:MAG TPA: hypothetical protein VN408_07455 [Actinoplanes sp.]|nr:hypothetical protein [Actinoplanes sp.]